MQADLVADGRETNDAAAPRGPFEIADREHVAALERREDRVEPLVLRALDEQDVAGVDLLHGPYVVPPAAGG